jgi:hypothetical protein
MATRLDINIRNSNLQISSKDPKIKVTGNQSSMKLNQTKSKFTVKQKFDKVDINNYPPDKQLYRKNPTDLRRQIINYSKQKGNDAVSQYVREGNRAMELENDEKNLISNLAKESSFAKGKKDIRITYFPQEPIEIKVKKGYMKVDSKPSSIKPSVQKNIKVEATPGDLQIGADQYPKVEIQAITTSGNNFDTKV